MATAAASDPREGNQADILCEGRGRECVEDGRQRRAEHVSPQTVGHALLVDGRADHLAHGQDVGSRLHHHHEHHDEHREDGTEVEGRGAEGQRCRQCEEGGIGNGKVRLPGDQTGHGSRHESQEDGHPRDLLEA